jgi:hypothetical protein
MRSAPVRELDLPPVESFPTRNVYVWPTLDSTSQSDCGAPMAHDEWTKSLPDGRVAKYIYDEIVEVCSASIRIGEYSKSYSNLKGPTHARTGRGTVCP